MHPRLLPGIGLSVTGPVQKATRLRGSKASTPTGIRSKQSLVANPLPPRYVLAKAAPSSSICCAPVPTSTVRILPPYPYIPRPSSSLSVFHDHLDRRRVLVR